MRVIVAGGGTGGHVFPALAIVEELRGRDAQIEVRYVGKRHGIEARLTRERGIPFRAVSSGAFARRGGLRGVWSICQLAWGFMQSVFLLLRFRPQVVVGTGGYVSVPPVAAAALLRVPTLLHEQNSVPGRANRLLARWASGVAVTFPESATAFGECSVFVTGNPVRADLRPEALAARDRAEARRSFDLDSERFTVFVFGGSQGARALTDATLDALAHLPADRVQVLLMAGATEAARAAAIAREAAVPCVVRAFIDDMAAAYVAADIVVARAGASTLAEIAAAGLPAILVPYPYAIDDHQQKNAEALQRAGAADVVAEDALAGADLAARIVVMLDDPAERRARGGASRRAAMPAAAERIADLVCDLAIPGGAA